MKRKFKRLIQRVTAAVAPSVWRHYRGNKLLILMYHRVLPADHEDRQTEEPGMYVSPQSLRMHFELLKKHFVPVYLDDWVRSVRAGTAVPRMACAVTFDDGWRDNYDHAFPVIQAAGIPAHIFLVSDFVGTSTSVWTARIARLLKSTYGNIDAEHSGQIGKILRRAGLSDQLIKSEPTRDLISQVIAECKKHHTDYEMSDLLKEAESVLGWSSAAGRRDFMNWEEVHEMVSSGHVRFGSHTRNHTRLLAQISDQIIEYEVGSSRAVVESGSGKEAGLFCYPNGDYTDAALKIVSSHYDAAVTTKKGSNTVHSDLFQLKRIGLHEDISSDEVSYLSRLTGWI
jgi:peptidoglycan/xylan/chitin deacetylase (PgdA/CDA1 family)